MRKDRKMQHKKTRKMIRMGCQKSVYAIVRYADFRHNPFQEQMDMALKEYSKLCGKFIDGMVAAYDDNRKNIKYH